LGKTETRGSQVPGQLGYIVLGQVELHSKTPISKRNKKRAGCLWLMSVILAVQEAEIRNPVWAK
jgi:hypothetical protein